MRPGAAVKPAATGSHLAKNSRSPVAQEGELLGDRRRSSVRSGRNGPLPSTFLTKATPAPVSFVVTCAQCREEVLEADQIGDEEECALRDHLLASHPKTLQPETFGVLLRHFVVTERAPPAGALTRAGALRPKDD